MRLIDLDQTVFVPLIDESKGGVKYEVQMTIAEVFDKFFDGVQPEIIAAIPVEWLQRRRDIYLKAYHAGHESEIHTAAILNDTLRAWRKERRAR